MFFILPLVLSSLFLPAACQFDDSGSNPDGFHPDSLTGGLFALCCIFAFLYGVLGIWNFVALLTSRGHRSPYAFLLPTILFFAWSNAAFIALILLENIPALQSDSFFDGPLPVLLLPSLRFVANLFNDWAVVLLFLVLIAVLWNRETMLRLSTDGKFGGHHPALIALHATLASLTFIFGTATEAFLMDTNVRFATTDISFDEIDHRFTVDNQLYYVYTTFAVLMGVDVAVTTVLLWRGWKKAGIPDKITNIMLYAVVPLYSVLCLFYMIFTIVFSPSGIPSSATRATFEGADIADSLLITGFTITIMFMVLFLSVKKAYWNPNGIGQPPKQQQYWAPQPQYVYATPPQVPQAGYYVAGAQQPGPYGQPQHQMYPAPQMQGSPNMQYAQPHDQSGQAYPQQHESTVGSYTPTHASTQPMPASPGSYSPPQSVQGPHGEKTGLHVS
ncbi:hypothetical protein C8R47DRAFT_729566 [Mycena vitilis]|nr:hypothetical protein C8R47DRAFT_729566 [Mycena vitilis]